MIGFSQTFFILGLHMVAVRDPFFPYIEESEWIISHFDSKNCIINDEQG
jgi:hypothetical protein